MKPNATSVNAVKSKPGASPARKVEKRFQRAALLTGLTFVLGAKSVLAQDPRWVTVDELKPRVPTSDPTITTPGISGLSHDVGVVGDSIFSVGSARYDTNGAYSAIIRKSPSRGMLNTWTEVDYYAPTGWPHRKYRAFGAGTVGTQGTHYAAGDLFRLLPSGQWKSAWMVQKSVNGGENWVEDEIYQKNGQEWDKASCFDIKCHPNGDVYAVGSSVTTGFSWEVRKKPAGLSSTWLADPVDTVGPKFFATQAHAVAFNGSNILVVGRVDSGTGGLWTVRRSIDKGATWATVDTFQDGKGAVSEAMGIAVGPPGVIYVSGWAGQSARNGTVYNWAVRRSLNGGTTWTTVDRFGAQAGSLDTITVMAKGVTVAPSGTVFVAGITPPPRKLMVRKGTTSSTGVMTWVVSDQLVDSLGRESTGYAIAADALGNIYCSGQSQIAADGTGSGSYITRKLPVP